MPIKNGEVKSQSATQCLFVFLSISEKTVDQIVCILFLHEPEVKRFYCKVSEFDDTLMVVLTFSF